MPLFLKRYDGHIAVVLAIVAAVIYIDHRGYQRAKVDTALAESRRQAAEAEMVRKIEKTLVEGLAAIDGRTADRLAAIDQVDRTIVQPTIVRELARDPRYSDPAAGISVELRDALNAARGAAPQRPGAGGANP